MRRRRSAAPQKIKKTPTKILDIPVPEGLHSQIRKQLAKVAHPDISGADTTAEMAKINKKLEKIQAIQEKSTHIQFVVDSSGSMSNHKAELVNSYNKLLERQARYASGSTYGYKSFHDEILPESLNNPRYFNQITTSGGTPLFDTIGGVIRKIDERLGNPTDVVVIILTDGYDTGHSPWDKDAEHFDVPKLHDLVQEKIALGWQFIYCTQERSISDAEKIGIPAHSTTVFGQYNKLLGQINQMLTSYRQGDVKLLTFGGSDVVHSQ